MHSPTPETGYLGVGQVQVQCEQPIMDREVDISGEEQVQGGEGSKHDSKMEGMGTD